MFGFHNDFSTSLNLKIKVKNFKVCKTQSRTRTISIKDVENIRRKLFGITIWKHFRVNTDKLSLLHFSSRAVFSKFDDFQLLKDKKLSNFAFHKAMVPFSNFFFGKVCLVSYSTEIFCRD